MYATPESPEVVKIVFSSALEPRRWYSLDLGELTLATADDEG